MVLSFIWVCISFVLVLCNNLVLEKLLSKGSKGANRTCCKCNSCSHIYNCSDYFSSHYCRLIFCYCVPVAIKGKPVCDIWNMNSVVDSEGDSSESFLIFPVLCFCLTTRFVWNIMFFNKLIWR